MTPTQRRFSRSALVNRLAIEHPRAFFFMMFDFSGEEYPQNGSRSGIAMEGDESAAVEATEGTPLDELKAEESSLWSLLRLLLSGKTLPHLVLVVGLSLMLQLMAVQGSESMSALGFISLSGGYLLTGMLSGSGRIQGWIQLPDAAESMEQSRIKRLVFSFRICIFPLIMAVVVLFALLALVGEQGALGDLTGLLPVLLSSCFVIWAIVQGRGFGRWLASLAASKLPDSEDRVEGGLRRHTISSYVLLMALSGGLIAGFEWMAGGSLAPAQFFLDHALFFVALTAVFVLAWRRSFPARLQASSRSDFHSFSNRWMLLSQLLIAWHLLTVWRHWTITPSDGLLMLEEFLLMMFTVLMAIWGLTSRSYRSTMKLVNSNNALPVGLAFGYAYAGSVAMLTTVLDDVRNVMMAGHIVVVLTFLWMQPRVLAATMGGVKATERIQQVVEEAVPIVEAQALPEGEPDEALDSATVSQTEDASDDSKDDTTPQSIGEGVSWTDPDVLASDVSWDDDEIELLD